MVNVTKKNERPDPEVVPKAQRRRFSAEYKLRVLGNRSDCLTVCPAPGWRLQAGDWRFRARLQAGGFGLETEGFGPFSV